MVILDSFINGKDIRLSLTRFAILEKDKTKRYVANPEKNWWKEFY